jgi:thiamine biosynthesis lipoprotein
MVSFTVKGMALDLGGIAKGYALDRAFEAIRACGVTGGVLDLGGNLKLLPSPPPGKKFYTVGIKNPADPSSLLQNKLQLLGDCAVSTSGDYERFVIIDNRRYGHIIDPRTGFPAPANAVTVTTTSAMDADIFSTTAYINGKKSVDNLSKSYPGTKFYFTESTTVSNTSRYL